MIDGIFIRVELAHVASSLDSLRMRWAVYNPIVGWWKKVADVPQAARVWRTDTGLHQPDTPGAVRFEIANHLGNVVAVVSDRKIAVDSLTPLAVQHFVADRLMLRDYYAFGMAMPGRSWAVDSGYRFGFNGKEIMLGLNGLDFGARVNDVRLGRWLSVDPLAGTMPAWSPYSFAFNSPISFIDESGEYPIYIITRSYAPFKTFGPGYEWYGDNRGHSLDINASSRTSVMITHDTETRQRIILAYNSRSHTIDGSKDATSATKIFNRSSGSFIDVHSYGNNAAQPGSWDIDQFTKIQVSINGDIKGDHVLHLKGSISGDDFPNQESFVFDSQGNKVWLGNYETSGSREWGPVTDLPLENENDINIKVDVRIKVDKDGVFQGVFQKDNNGNDSVIPIEQWNKRFQKDEN